MKFGCDVNAQDSDGWTPLHCAASCNNLEMVKFLVDMGLVFLPLLYLIVKLQLKNVKKRKKREEEEEEEEVDAVTVE